MNGIMTAKAALEFYHRHTGHRYSKADNLMQTMLRQGLAWHDPNTGYMVTDGNAILDFIEIRKNLGNNNRNQRATATSKTASRNFNYPIGKAAKKSKKKPATITSAGAGFVLIEMSDKQPPADISKLLRP